ncbi:MAG: extracellular solute-binding protein [Patescibacteria group bacterium]|jgi:ABC-type glycerol-3-phosphate transport system substrate-binding protein
MANIQFPIKFTILTLISIMLLTSAFGCKDSVSKEEANKLQSITLNYWRVWDGEDTFSDIIRAYKAIHPNITIKYKKLRYEEYEQELIESFAEDRGPDILSLHAGWMNRYKNKLAPLPEEITMAYSTVRGTIKKEEVVELATSRTLTAGQIKEQFIDTVYNNAVIGGEIYGLPMSVDTMVLFYNRDLLNGAGITEVPQYWNDKFLEDVKNLTRQNEAGEIIQSGAALGTSDNIERYSDILSLLMMQNGAQMISDDGSRVTFQTALRDSTNAAPGLDALRFYTDFANPVKQVYSWNKEMPNSLEAFAQGRLATFFGYAYHLPMIETRAPRLNFGISPMLQIEGNVNQMNFANFWLESVSNKSAYQDEAWDFIQFAVKAENAQSYLAKAKKPTALRSLINQQKADDDLAIFANQLLTSKTWYRGNDYNAAEVIIGEMIDEALIAETEDLNKIISSGAYRVQQTLK